MKEIIDGIVCQENYKNSEYKIMWILKEGNVADEHKDYDRNICQEFNNDEHKANALSIATFRKLIYATYGILHPEVKWKDVPFANAEAYEVIKHIAYVNINKCPGSSQSKDSLIFKAYTENKEKLLSQIYNCSPDIIIFGGTMKYFDSYDMKNIGWNISDNKKKTGTTAFYSTKETKISPLRLCVDAYHPAYSRISNEEYWKEIKLAIQMWKDEIQEN